MSTKAGSEAEKLVAKYLKSHKHKILAQNWRTRWCEIDIISNYEGVVYFTEVKFRSSDVWGDGLEYITPAKLKQMQFAAEFWLTENGWDGEASLQAAAVSKNGEITLLEI